MSLLPSRFTVIAGLATLLLLGACGGESSRCRSHESCDDGLTCQAGRCTGEGIGAECGDDDGCAGGLVCADHLPGGYCTESCDTPADCPEGTVCVVQGGEGFCLAGCTESRQCRDGYVCSGGACTLPCESDAECDGGYVCQDGRCEGSDTGRDCGADADCGDELVCAHPDRGGYCTSPCSSQSDCPVGSVCGSLLGEPACLARCRIDDDCGGDRLCDRGACQLRCTYDEECGEEAYCSPAGVCRSATDSDAETLEFGEVSPGTLIDFEVGADVHSITLVVQGPEQTTFRFSRIVDPEGTERITSGAGGDGLTAPHRTMPKTQINVTQIPMSDDPAMGILPGTWSFAFQGGTGHASVVLKRGGTDAGTVPLNVFVAPQAFGDGIDSSNVGDLPHFQAVLDEWAHFFEGQADVSLGEIRFFDVSAEFTDIQMDIFGGNMEYEEMFKRYGRDDGLNAFFVRSISVGGFGGVAGVSGGIPGPPRIGETRHSGVVLEVQDQPRFTGLTFCHEAGHFHGLFHTSEQAFFGGGGTHDLLSDTPECSPGQDPCTESKRHLMFPALEPEMDTLSPASGMVIRAHAGVE